MSERLAEKLPLEAPSSPTDKAEAPANDALVRRSGSWRLHATYADKDPREIMKTLLQGNRSYIDKFDELLDGMEAQLEDNAAANAAALVVTCILAICLIVSYSST